MFTAGSGDSAGAAVPASDLVSLSGVLRVCELDLVLLDGRSPRALVQSQVHDGGLLCSVELGSRLRGRFVLPQDWCALGFMRQANVDGNWCHGVTLLSDMAVAALPEGATEFMVDAGTRMTVVLIPVRRLHEAYGELSLTASHAQSSRLRPFLVSGSEWGQRLRIIHEDIHHSLERGEVPADDLLGRLVEAHVQAALSAGTMDSPPCPRGQRAHYLTLQRAENYMRLHIRRDIYMEELCQTIGVSDRALRYAFKHLLGVSPNRYLSMMRLCAACRSLSSADAEVRSVKSVALSCGLWDLSRFADNYRRVFGELPSDTLQRAPAQYFGDT